jgi:hypothetical protein
MTAPFNDAAAQLIAAIQRGDAVTHEDVLRMERKLQYGRLTAAVKRATDGETDWDSLSHMMGRNELPDLLLFVWDRLPHDQLVRAVGDAWSMCEFPERKLPRKEWLPMFRAAGYHVDDEPASPPNSITLWRGGVRKTRMAWTADRERAEWFRDRFDTGKPVKLWTLDVGPDRLLAHYHQKHRNENEYVIDPTGIRPREAR